MRSTILLTVATASLLLTLNAHAADKGIYLGAGLGQSDVTVSADTANNLNSDFSGTDSAYKIIAGVRILDNFAVEANYVDLGKPDSGRNYADSTGVSAFAVGLVKAGPVDFFGKAGGINWRSNIRTANGTFKKDGTDFAYGVGLQVRLLDLAIRGEYERFNTEGGANLLTLGLTWTFL